MQVRTRDIFRIAAWFAVFVLATYNLAVPELERLYGINENTTALFFYGALALVVIITQMEWGD